LKNKIEGAQVYEMDFTAARAEIGSLTASNTQMSAGLSRFLDKNKLSASEKEAIIMARSISW
jgi:hypothetical protein